MEQSTTVASVETDGISIGELCTILIRKLPLIVLSVIVCLLAAYLYLQIVVAEYQTTVTILVDPIKQSSTIGKVLSSDFFDTKKDISTEVQLITNRTNLLAALDQLELSSYKTEEGRTYAEPGVLGSLRGKVTVNTVKNTNIVEISVRDQNPLFATDYANALASSFNHMLSGFSKESKSGQLEFLDTQIPLVEKQLEEATEKLYDYRFRTRIDFLSRNSTSLVDHISHLNTKVRPLLLQADQNKSLIEAYKKTYHEKLPPNVYYMQNETLMPKISAYQAIFEELILYEIVSNRYIITAYPAQESLIATVQSRVFELNSQIESYRRTIFGEILSTTKKFLIESKQETIPLREIEIYSRAVFEVILCNAEINTIRSIVATLEEETNKLPLVEKEVSRLSSDVDSLESIRKELNSFREQIALTSAAENSNVKIVSYALIPSSPVKIGRAHV